MNNLLLSDNFIFHKAKFYRYHYTDHRKKGSPMNYLAYMVKGRSKIVSKNKTIYVNEGDVFFIPKNLEYQSYWYGMDEIEFLSFGYLNLLAEENRNYELQVIPCGRELVRKMLEIPTLETRNDCKTLSRFYDVMAEAIPCMISEKRSKSQEIVEEAKKYIQAHPYEAISEVAKACKVSEPYLYSVFKKQHRRPQTISGKRFYAKRAWSFCLRQIKK